MSSNRDLATAVILAQSGAGQVAELPGRRMAKLTFSTEVNTGFKELSFDLLARDGSADVPEQELTELQARWRFGTFRLFLGGGRAWEGQVRKIIPGRFRSHPLHGQTCAVSVFCRGSVVHYQRLIANLPPRQSEEDDPITASADDLIRQATETLGGAVAPTYDHVMATGVSVPLQNSDDLYWYDHITNATKAGTSDGRQVYFAVWFTDEGPWLQPLGTGPADWRLSVIGTDLAFPWDGDEYVDRGRAGYSSSDVDLSTDFLILPRGAELHHGWTQERTITLDRLDDRGAEAAFLTFLNQHVDPRAPQGQPKISPMSGQDYARVRTRDGGSRPAWEVRGGQNVWLYDLLPSDPYLTADDRVRAVLGTTWDHDAGALTLKFDDRPIRSRRNERPAFVSVERGLVEPGAKGNSIVSMRAKESATQKVDGKTQVLLLGADGDVEFYIKRAGVYEITFGAVMSPRNTNNTGKLSFGYELDGEGWSDSIRARTVRTRADATSTNDRSIDATRPRSLSRGSHVMRFWADESVGGASVAGCHVGVRF